MFKGEVDRESEPQHKPVAFIFPGQGSLTEGSVSESLFDHPAGRKVFEEADSVVGFPLSKIILGGTKEDLFLPEIVQPATVTASLAALAVYEDIHGAAGSLPDAVAGHSVGTYSALASAGVLTRPEAILLARKRALSMKKAAEGREAGEMVAIMSRQPFDQDRLRQWCEEEGIDIANINSPQQVVISGDKNGIKGVLDKATSSGLKAFPLRTISDGFHSKLLNSEIPYFERLAQDTRFYEPKTPVYLNSTGKPASNAQEIREALAYEMATPVLWTATIENMRRTGIQHFVEFGPSNVLSKFVQAIDHNAKTTNVNGLASAISI